MAIKNSDKFKLKRLIINFADSRSLELACLKPTDFLSSSYGSEMFSSKVKKDRDFINEVHCCKIFADSYHKKGIILSTLNNKFLNICYLGEFYGRSEIYGPVTNQKSKIVYNPSERLIIEDTNKRIDVDMKLDYVQYSLRDKSLERLISKIKGSHSEIKVYEDGLSDDDSINHLKELIFELF
ncbi:MAG: hypothetical protein WCX73_01565 [Candidatus Pacearchaeota archaeon]|jgi:hypothetical protein